MAKHLRVLFFRKLTYFDYACIRRIPSTGLGFFHADSTAGCTTTHVKELAAAVKKRRMACRLDKRTQLVSLLLAACLSKPFAFAHLSGLVQVPVACEAATAACFY